MRTSTLTALLALVPSLALAQASVQASGQTRADAGVSAGRSPAATPEKSTEASAQAEDQAPREQALRGLSAEGRARAEAMLETAQEKDLPEGALVGVLLEGQAKGGTEAQLLRAEEQALAKLVLSQETLVRAGRFEPSDEEVSRGAGLIAQGAAIAQLEALVRRSPPEQSLAVAFTAVSELVARGIPVSDAVAEIGGTLAAGGQVGPGALNAGAATSGSATSSVGQLAGGASAAGSTTGTVGGVVGR